MHHPLRNGRPLSGRELDGPAFQGDHEASLDYVEEFAFLVVLKPSVPEYSGSKSLHTFR